MKLISRMLLEVGGEKGSYTRSLVLAVIKTFTYFNWDVVYLNI